ncbi:hypothetical protein [Propionivibrio sp.]|uniref:hypothetical protein n=1 Tax=Propionivibrio sp. TaxID=2212460 RepID=UPI003BF461A9
MTTKTTSAAMPAASLDIGAAIGENAAKARIEEALRLAIYYLAEGDIPGAAGWSHSAATRLMRMYEEQRTQGEQA